MIIDATDRFAPGETSGQPGGHEKAVASIGEQAWNALFGDMQGTFDLASRQVFAANYGGLLKKYGYPYPRYFETLHTDVAESYESFRTMFGIMKNPDSKKLPARKIYWKNYCELVIKRLKEDGITVLPGYIAHRLAFGTEYHPTATAATDVEQVVRLYQTLATNINEKFDLLDQYREISDHKVDIVRENVRHKRAAEWGPDVEVLNKPLSEYFSNDYLSQHKFSAERFIDLNRHELTETMHDLLEIAEAYDDSKEGSNDYNLNCYYFYAQQEIRSYLMQTDRARCHVELPEDFFDDDNIAYHSHCLLGIFLDEPEFGAVWVDEHKQRIKGLLENQGWPDFGQLDSIYTHHDIGSISWAQLVLFPNNEMNELIPCVIIWEEESTSLVPIDEDVIAARGSYFISTDFPATGSENQSLIDLLKDHRRIKKALIETAGNLRKHPVLQQKASDELELNEMIESLREPLED